MGGSSPRVTSVLTSPKRAITLGASLRGMWMICDTSRLNLKPSAERTVMVDRLASTRCVSVLVLAQFRTTFAVGTLTTLCVFGLIGYLPGSSGSTHTPFLPRTTSASRFQDTHGP